jgi:subtilisin family serine protease
VLGTTLAVAPVTATAGEGATRAARSGAVQSYLVLADRSASRAEAVRAIKDAGGTVVSVNRDIGLYKVTSRATGFAGAARAEHALRGATRDRSIGRLPDTLAKGDAVVKAKKVERENRGNARTSTAAANPGPTEGMDPLDSKLWGLTMVHSDRARAVNAGDRRVLVGVLDSGIDVRNPDLAGKVDLGLSRNFTTDIPQIDGPCEFPSCKDPVGWDDSGHGTHVSGTIAAAANGFGVSGVAPDVTLVEIRGGQDSGFLFLKPVSDALTYAADNGIDVVNMSFYVDPWLYNCVGGAKEDSPQEAAEQQMVLDTMNTAMNYAHSKGVTLVGSLGNNHEDISKPRTDTSSPDYPPSVAPHARTIVNSTCFDMPVEGQHVIGVSALGPSETKSDYSNYASDLTSGEIEVSAPGGWFRDGFGTPTFQTNENLILSTYPVNALQAEGEVGKNGRITKSGKADGVIKQCPGAKTPYTECGYYAYLQGTSMASPHVTGVAALIVSAWGSGTTQGNFGLAPDTTRNILLASARDHACPNPPLQTYTNEGRSDEFSATCVGTAAFNGFYGDGIVDAYAAVTTGAGT